MASLADEHRRGLFEIIEDRYDHGSTLFASQALLKNGHQVIGDPTFADAILDRLVHNAYKIRYQGRFHEESTKKLDQIT